MRGVNKVFLLGSVGKDPEIRSTPSGTSVATFSLATSDRVKKNDEWVDETTWHNMLAFSRTAEIVRDYVKKGTPIYVEGKIQTRSWDDKESGEKKYRTEILVNELILLGNKPESDAPSENKGRQTRSTPTRTSRSAVPAKKEEVDPFADTLLQDDDLEF
jgi:single-strand DNA-binding protein